MYVQELRIKYLNLYNKCFKVMFCNTLINIEENHKEKNNKYQITLSLYGNEDIFHT